MKKFLEFVFWVFIGAAIVTWLFTVKLLPSSKEFILLEELYKYFFDVALKSAIAISITTAIERRNK